jgi:CRP-like cAMP-binding protein
MGTKDLARHLAEVPLFSHCTKRELATVARHAETVTLDDGVPLITEGDAGDAFFVILDGKATVSHDGKVVAEVADGASFGELALLDGRPRSATVTANGPVTVAVLGVRMFRTLLREFPDLTEQLLAGLAGQLRDAWASDQAH